MSGTGTPGPNLGLTFGWTDHDNGWGSATNDLIEMLDSVIMASVESMTLATPPMSPAAGARYIVGASPTGAWSGKAGKLAVYITSAWVFYTPLIGFRIYNKADGFLYLFNSSSAWMKEIDTGETPFTAMTAWTTATAYTHIPPASYVSQGGSSYVCLTDHTSGTFATDLAAGKWGLVAQRGSDALKTLANWATATAYTATLPASFVAINGSTYACAVSHTSGTFATDLAAGKWIPVALAGAANTIYDLSMFIQGFIPAGQRIYRLVLSRAIEAPIDLAGSVGVTRVNPNATYAFDLKKNGTTFGTVSISTSGVFTFTTVSHAVADFVAGDYIDVFGAAVADTALQDVSLTLSFTRS